MTILSCAFRWRNYSLQFFLWKLQEAEIGSFKGNNFASLMWNQEENWDKLFSFTLEQFSHLLDLFVSGDTESTLLSQEEGRFDCNWIVFSKLVSAINFYPDCGWELVFKENGMQQFLFWQTILTNLKKNKEQRWTNLHPDNVWHFPTVENVLVTWVQHLPNFCQLAPKVQCYVVPLKELKSLVW